jgi:hypothetical protein
VKTWRFVLIIAFVICFGLSLSYAQEINAKGSCKADIEKFCKDVEPGQGRIARCIKQHEAELSAACRDQIAEAREKTKEFAKSCKPDAEKFCQDIQPGQGRIIGCLKRHQIELSVDCGAYFKKK